VEKTGASDQAAARHGDDDDASIVRHDDNGQASADGAASDSDPLNWHEYEEFLQDCFPENIKVDCVTGNVLWFDKRVVGEWRAVFARMKVGRDVWDNSNGTKKLVCGSYLTSSFCI
jgi:hypothetical protein